MDHVECATCRRGLLADAHWRRLPAEARLVLRRSGWARNAGRSMCANCYDKACRAGEFQDESRWFRSRSEVLGEWAFLHEAGELNREDSQAKRIRQAAPRIGMGVKALERHLLRAKSDGLRVA